MNEKVFPDDPPATRTEGEGETLDMPEGMQGFAQGQVLGERYQIRSQLGRGGMGEVWRAFDLKLRVEMALKAFTNARAVPKEESHTRCKIEPNFTAYRGWETVSSL